MLLIVIFRVLEYPENAPKIDWSFYKSRVPVAGMVDNFQKQYEAFKIPYPADNVTAQIAEQEKAAVSTVDHLTHGMNRKIP